jgi:hypothetical protein
MGKTPDNLMYPRKDQPPDDVTVNPATSRGPDDIVHDVERARARLAQDLNQLEYHVRKEFDWRVQFDRHPWLFVGTAFAVSFLFGLAITPRSD